MKIYRDVRAQPARVAVLCGNLAGLAIAVAQACVIANVPRLLLVDTSTRRLFSARNRLDELRGTVNSQTRVAHQKIKSDLVPDEYERWFQSVRNRTGVSPDLLVIEDPQYQKYELLQSFSHGLSREPEEDIIVVALARCSQRRNPVSATFYAYAETSGGCSWFTVNDLRDVGSALANTSYLLGRRLMSEETVWLINTTLIGDVPRVSSAQTAPVLRRPQR